MKDERGSILVLTIGFILFFTLLGLGSIYSAMSQNEMAEKQRFSAEAFWLADAGIEKGKSNLLLNWPAIPIIPSGQQASLGEGTYYFNSGFDIHCTYFNPDTSQFELCPNRCLIHSSGTVNIATRTIEAVFAAYDITKALTAEGYVKTNENERDEDGNLIEPTGNDGICGPEDPAYPSRPLCEDAIEEGATFSLESVFGMTEQEFKDIAIAQGHAYLDPGNLMDDDVSGVTWIDMVDDRVVFMSNTDCEGDGILIVDTRNFIPPGQSPNYPELRIEGGDFCGIIWVFGEFELHGNSGVSGAIFVQAGEEDEIPLSGTASLVFSPSCIQAAVDEIIEGGGNPELGTPSTVAWREL